MAIGIVMNESSLALVEETTEGTYVSPSTGTDYVEPLSDGLELNKTRELLERDNLSSTVETESARVGIADVTGTIPVELKASTTSGDAPQSLDVLLKSLLGGKRQVAATTTSGTGHTSTVINLDDGDAADFTVGDVVVVQESGAYEARPISAVSTTIGSNSITFPFALTNGAPSDNVVISKTTTYFHKTDDSITFSAEHNIGSSAIKQKVNGLRCASGEISNWTVGQLPQMSFSVQGLGLDRVDEDATASPDFSADGVPPVALQACAWIDGNKMSYTEMTSNIENTIQYIQDACDADGRIGSRITQQTVNVNINPYMEDDDTSKVWDKFNDNDNVSFFAYAYNPTSTAGEFEEAVAIWIPQAKIIESPVADADGIVTNAAVLRAHRNNGNDSVFLGFI